MGMVLQGASLGMQLAAYQAQASNARTIAKYNANVDEQEARQIAEDTKYNVSQIRQQGKEYISRQEIAYATAGVAQSGSALAVQATTAGRIERMAMEENRQADLKQKRLYAAATMGILEGEAQAKQSMLAAWGTGLGGLASIGRTAYSNYQTGNYWG